MTQPEIPPCPDELLRKLREPARFDRSREGGREAGTIWEARTPGSELLLFLIVQRFEERQAAPFAFVRAVPLSDFVRLIDAGDAIVAIESSGTIFAAHCWLEGPVLPQTLVRCLGSATPASMEAVAEARALVPTTRGGGPVAAFRESLYAQFDPVFAECWRMLYASLGDEETLAAMCESDSRATRRAGRGPALLAYLTEEVEDATENERRPVSRVQQILREVAAWPGPAEMYFIFGPDGQVKEHSFVCKEPERGHVRVSTTPPLLSREDFGTDAASAEVEAWILELTGDREVALKIAQRMKTR